MTYRVGVIDDPMRQGVRVVIGIPGESSGTVVTQFDAASGVKFERVELQEVVPSILIPDDIARPLLDALSAHYGGSGDTRMLRRDYEAERSRVDRLIATLIELAQSS